jgi:hypothetical protein
MDQAVMEAQGYMRSLIPSCTRTTRVPFFLRRMARGAPACGLRTRALNIRYFFLADQVAKENLEIEYESTMENMWGDYMSKPLRGKLFRKFKVLIMGHGVKPLWLPSFYFYI